MTAPSEIDLALYEPEFDHALCRAEADLYGTAFCLATRKPGPCLGQHRPGTILTPPTPVKIPAAPAAPTADQKAAAARTDAGYQQAYMRAAQVATSAGLAGARHGEVHVAMHDYATALHGHQRAEAHAQAAYQRAQGAHDTAEARQAAQTAAFAAREAAAEARAKAAVAKANLHHAARAKAKAKLVVPPGFSVDLYGLVVPTDFELYGLISWAHQDCEIGTFCRNPLHPGPCKGWKHMLHSVAPGAYHAYEQQRVAKLNEKRKAKIQALQKLGHPVPKHLLKEITYEQVPKAPTGTPFVAPTPKEAVSKLPATAKEIGEKIALKHAEIAGAKKAHQEAQADAFGRIVAALHPDTPGNGDIAKANFQKYQATLKPDEKITDVPLIQTTADALAKMAGKKAGLNDKQVEEIKQDILQHIEGGHEGVPVLVESAINHAKKAAEHQAEFQKKLDMHAKTDWSKAAPGERFIAHTHMDDIKASPHATPEQKAQATAIKAKINKGAEAQKAKTEGAKPWSPVLSDADVPESSHMAGEKHVDVSPVGIPSLMANPDSKAAQALKAKQEQVKKANLKVYDAYMDQVQKHLDSGKGWSDLPESQQVGLVKALAHIRKMAGPDSAQKKRADELEQKLDIPEGWKPPGKKTTAPELKPKVTGPLAHPDMMHVVDLTKGDSYTPPSQMIAAFQKPGVTKAEYDKLPPATQDKIKAAVAKMWDYSPPNAQLVAHELGLGHPALLEHAAPSEKGVTPAAPLGHDVAPHVKAAQSIATGSAYMTDTKKVAAYSKLTPEEYHALPADVQAKIHDHLQAAHAKFVSPAKKKQVQDILTKLGMPGEGAGAGAPHGASVHQAEAEKYVKGWDAIKTLANGSGLPDHQAAAEKLAAKPEQMAAHEEMVTKGLSQQWADIHLSDLPLTSDEKNAIKAKAKAEMSQMLHSGATQPEPGGVLDFGAGFSAHGGTPAEKASLYKNIVGIGSMEPVGAGAGGPMLSGDADKHAKGHVAALKYIGVTSTKEKNSVKKDWADGVAQSPEDTAEGLADVWREKHLDHLTSLNADQVDALTRQAANEFLDMIHNGKSTANPDGLVAKVHNGTVGGTGLGYLADSLIGGDSNLPHYIPGGTGGGTAMTHDKATAILGAFKMQVGASQLKHDPADLYDNLVAVAHHYKVTLREAMHAIDEKHSANLGVPNGGLLEKKITDWLKTPEGKAYAEANKKPKAAYLSPLTGKAATPKGFKLKAGEKVPTLPGPGAFDSKLKADDFKHLTSPQVIASQTKYMQKTGQQWTPDQQSALVSYTTASGSMNNYLRGEDHNPSEALKQKVINAQAAMRPLQEHTLLVRGASYKDLPEAFRSHEGALKMVGKTFQADGFTSTSTSGDGSGFGGELKLTIEAPKGTMGVAVDHISSFEGEKEVLLAAGTKFRVISVTGSHGYTEMRVRVVGAKSPTTKKTTAGATA